MTFEIVTGQGHVVNERDRFDLGELRPGGFERDLD